MTRKMLSVDPARCDGCRDCEVACSERNRNGGNSKGSRIHIITADEKGIFHLPVTCQHCEAPPCMAVCPNQAIYRDDELHRVMINRERCVGCQMCVSACPFGALRFDFHRGCAFKCDLCGGDPGCVKACERKALAFVEDHSLHQRRLDDSARKHYQVLHRMVR